MYNCDVCGEASKPGQPRLIYAEHHVVIGQSQIKRELSCCTECKGGLASGYSLAQIRKWAEQNRLRDRVNAEMARRGKMARFV